MQVEAERKKRAAILESEGVREADINVAEGKRKARILASEAERQEQINKATGEAAAILSVAEARAGGLKLVAQALELNSGPNAASLSVAEQYVQAFNKLAQTNNTLILPANAGDISGLVAQVRSFYIYSKLFMFFVVVCVCRLCLCILKFRKQLLQRSTKDHFQNSCKTAIH